MDAVARNIFAVDGLGGVVSTGAMTLLWLGLQPWVGVPSNTLMLLAIVAASFAVYSLSCWRLRAPIVPWLPIVMVANLAYCVLTAALLVRDAAVVTGWGVAYFVGEIVVILGVVAVEVSVLRRSVTAARR